MKGRIAAPVFGRLIRHQGDCDKPKHFHDFNEAA
jgi:hypothetical protein